MKYIGHDDFEEIQRRCDVAVSVPGNDDRARQELARECDLNEILKRYQPWELPAREAFYGERDYDLDTHDAIQANRSAFDAWSKWAADPEIRSRFKTFGAFLNSYEAVLDGATEAMASERSESAVAGGGTSQPKGGSVQLGAEPASGSAESAS